MEQQPCPFCPLWGIDEELYESVGNDFFGQPAMIGDVPACAPCANAAAISGTAQEYLELLRAQQERTAWTSNELIG